MTYAIQTIAMSRCRPIPIVHIFTALHDMQMRSSDENYVCVSVRPSVVCRSNACIVTFGNKDRFRFLYHTKYHLA